MSRWSRPVYMPYGNFSEFSLAAPAIASAADFKPVTEDVLTNPDPADWLMINRTYDEQRFSPLDQINKGNVGQMRMAWTRGLPPGTQESTPIVYHGVMYRHRARRQRAGGRRHQRRPDLGILRATIPRTCRRHRRQAVAQQEPRRSTRTWSISPRPTASSSRSTPRPASCAGKPRSRLHGRHRAHRRHHRRRRQGDHQPHLHDRRATAVSSPRTTPGPARRRGSSTTPPRRASRAATPGATCRPRSAPRVSWGLPGSYDPKRKVLYWAIANPKPYTRLKRHGSADARVERVAGRSLQQFHRGARRRDRQAGLVLSAPARRRLGRRPHPRAHAVAHAGRSRSEVREVDQPDDPRGRGARHRRRRSPRAAACSRSTATPANSSGPTPFPYDVPDINDGDDRRRDRPHPHQRRGQCSRRTATRRLTCFYNTRELVVDRLRSRHATRSTFRSRMPACWRSPCCWQ